MLASGPQVGGPGAEVVEEEPLGAVGGVQIVPTFHCPLCQRIFSTKTGLGVHRTKAHPVEANEDVTLPSSKRRWSREECGLLARKEAELVRAGNSHINEELCQAFPRRTVDAIKSRRRNPQHQEAVNELVIELGPTQNLPVMEERRQLPLAVEERRQLPPIVEAPNEVDDEVMRWSQDEENLLARREAELVIVGARHLNQGLRGVIPRRTLDAIKGKRRQKSYRDRVAAYVEDLRAQGRPEREAAVGTQRIDERLTQERRNQREGIRQDEEAQANEEQARLPDGILNFLEERNNNEELNIIVGLLEEEGEVNIEGSIPGCHRNENLNVVIELLEEEVDTQQRAEDQDMPARQEYTQEPRQAIEQELRITITQDPPTTFCGAWLFQIAEAHLSGRDVREDLSRYLDEAFHPPRQKVRQRQANLQRGRVMSRRKRRKAEYAKIQDLYTKNRARCAEEILGIGHQANPFSLQDFENEWRPILEQDGGNRGRTKLENEHAKKELWYPITSQELRRHRMTEESAPGLDGITVKELKAVPSVILRVLYNIILATGVLPIRMNRSRTIFVPKVNEPMSPLDFRPISITSVLTRQLHKILAARMDQHLEWDDRQRGFIRADGCGENILLVSTIIRDSHEKKKELHIASLDIRKAFDSGTFGGIQDSLCEISCPEEFITYINNTQGTATTCLEVEGERTADISVKRGVRQGDPLSPKVFNTIINQLLKRFPRDIGYDLDGVRVNCGAFADDLLLFSSTAEGMQQLINIAEEELNPKGLEFHPDKCTSISLVPDGKRKKMKIVTNPTFKIAGKLMPATTVEGSFKYLGIKLTPTGVILYDNKDLEDNLDRLKAAPLKPQQRLCLLRDYLLPKYHHQLIFANLGAGKMNTIDIKIRRGVRDWLFLPHDVPNAFYHAAGKDGGLGIPSFRWMIPRLTSDRLKSLKNSGVPAFQSMSRQPSFIKQEKKAETLLNDRGSYYSTKASQQERWAALLYSTVDGRGLKEASSVPAAHHWLREGSSLLSGRDFLQAVKLRIGALPTRARTTRGRNEDSKCRAGCRAKETIQHLLQCCPRTHGIRVKRHDGVVKMLGGQLERRGHGVALEPHFRTAEGLRKPDLMITREGETYIIDVQIVQDDKPLEELHIRKTRYYANNESLVELVKVRSGRTNILFSSLTITWRGVICKSSAEILKRLGLGGNDVKMLALRTIQGSLHEWGVFNRMTEREARPAGIG